MKKHFRKVGYALILLFVLMNAVAYMHAYKFTHFATGDHKRTGDPETLSLFTRLKLLVTGVAMPKPRQKEKPSRPFSVFTLNSTKTLECWSQQVANAKGTVILFHGYAAEKSSLLARADEFLALGYNTVLVDFMGSGGSGGDETSVGYREAEQVKDCFEYVGNSGEQIVYLFGTSMGAVSILKAINDYAIAPAGVILECPFGSLYSTVCMRFKLMGVPSFPMAGLLAFWGGAQQGYWAFSHNPTDYAKAVKCPTLILYGEQDNRVAHEDVDIIYQNLQGQKVLKLYPTEGHNVFTEANHQIWVADITAFLQGNKSVTSTH